MTTALLVGTLALAAGTFAFRTAGPLLRTRIILSPMVERLVGMAAVVLFAALVATSALLDGQEFAGFARPAGVAVGGVLAWKKVPFVLVVLGAGATAAGLRLLRVP